jgi:hypothetical protein
VKNAGTSINRVLSPFCASRFQRGITRVLKKKGIYYPAYTKARPHAKAQELMELMGVDKYQRYFSFAFVRNPWDWQVSLYNYVLRSPDNHHYSIISSFMDFNEYIHWRCDGNAQLQKEFTHDVNGNSLVNFIGRYENLETDFQYICSKINVKVTLPVYNVSKTKPFQSYYTSETIELVRETFAADIDLFNYDFE